MRRFGKDYLAGENVLVMPGYEPTVGIRQILNVIVDDVLQLENAPTAMLKRLDLIVEYFSRSAAAGSPLYILLNCIDGKNFRTARAQAVLARLAAVPHIHLVATMDHINLPLLWSQTDVTRFSWLWEDCTTLEPYSVEAGYAHSHLLQQILAGNTSAQLVDRHLFINAADVDVVALTRLRHLMVSLTQNARSIFRLLVEYQLQAIEEAEDGPQTKSLKKTNNAKKSQKTSNTATENAAAKGMPLEELYWRCRDAFLASNEVTLRAQLTEFKDHKLIKFSKNNDGSELVSIPLDRASLKEILDNKDVFA
ncbi:unnamed protein product [Mesocestoides corti]|uniref:Origin recognition complex subunit 2 n=1 Tax=Mesocestoides corti TaxID=53468 RepID=A0A3P6HRJ2_MESCO|nr:unnamed protein product [Mesocestoides corti]